MKKSELIRENTENLINALKEADAAAYRNTACEYRVYIDSDGKCGHEEWLAGDSGWYEFTDPDYRRYYIHTMCHEYYDIVRDWWFADDEPDEYDREAIMDEAIYEATNSAEAFYGYEAIIEHAIESAIEAEREEEEEENEYGW